MAAAEAAEARAAGSRCTRRPSRSTTRGPRNGRRGGRPGRWRMPAGFGRRVGTGPCADLGCGTGWYAPALPAPTLALDAAWSMVQRTAETAPAALCVQGDLEALPVAAGRAARRVGAQQLRPPRPHRDPDGAGRPPPVARTRRAGRARRSSVATRTTARSTNDDLGGRSFSLWPTEQLSDVVVGAGFALDAVDELEAPARASDLTVSGRRARTLPDTVGPGMRLLVCGLNPSLYAADAGVGYGRPSNRFWRAAVDAGIVSRPRDPWHALRTHGVGLTDLVKRATVARERAVAGRVPRPGFAPASSAWRRGSSPAAVCFVGLAGWRAAVDPKAVVGSAGARRRRAPGVRHAEHERPQRPHPRRRVRRASAGTAARVGSGAWECASNRKTSTCTSWAPSPTSTSRCTSTCSTRRTASAASSASATGPTRARAR